MRLVLLLAFCLAAACANPNGTRCDLERAGDLLGVQKPHPSYDARFDLDRDGTITASDYATLLTLCTK